MINQSEQNLSNTIFFLQVFLQWNRD